MIKFDGTTSYIATWDVALSDEEVRALSNGISPRYIRPSNLIVLNNIQYTTPPYTTEIVPVNINNRKIKF